MQSRADQRIDRAIDGSGATEGRGREAVTAVDIPRLFAALLRRQGVWRATRGVVGAVFPGAS